ncbi:MAG: DUF4136 domain-containing protein [Flavobacteriaceae bacterium]|nr:DUF4136 domain-containing protein [Flavobacteriaceae bacterium]
MKFILVLIIPILISCGSTVAVDYEKGTDFSKYGSYNFYPSIDSGLSGLDNKRILNALDSLLQQKGFQKSENPQLAINFYAKEILTNSRNTLGIGIGGGGGNVGVGVSGGIPIGGREIEQQFTLDFIDTQNDALVWQGVAESRYKEKSTPQQKEIYYFSLLQKLLKKYPPTLK